MFSQEETTLPIQRYWGFLFLNLLITMVHRIKHIPNVHTIHLDNVKVSFKVKLLQYQLNEAIFKYSNKFALPIYINALKTTIADLVIASNHNSDKEYTELINKARELYKTLNKFKPNYTYEEKAKAIDDTLKYILYTYTKTKHNISLNDELELIKEIKLLLNYINDEKIFSTNRITNTRKLYNQLKASIINKV